MNNSKKNTENSSIDSKGIDSPKRSIAKAITWRFIATSTTFLISIIFFNYFTDKTTKQILGISGWIASVEIIAKFILYYLHERMWLNIKWGKYWKRAYWESRSWKRLYRKRHK